MTIQMKTAGVHHVAIRSRDLERARGFYAGTLGFPVVLEAANLFIFVAGQTPIAVRGPETATAAGDVFDPFRVGLDHIALACADEGELERVGAALAHAEVRNTGVKLDSTLNRRYVAFKDPDGIAWELYMAPDVAAQAVDAYFEGMRRGDMSDVPFSDDVTFESPLTTPLAGIGAVRGFLAGVLPAISGVTVKQRWTSGSEVAAVVEFQTVAGPVPAAEWFRVVDGRIASVRPFFDPRPLVAPPVAS